MEMWAGCAIILFAALILGALTPLVRALYSNGDVVWAAVVACTILFIFWAVPALITALT